ncbi:MAG: RNA polymerase sigma factor [bacterium]
MAEDKDLFWKLVEPEHLRARAFCRKLLRNREDGDDLYQDALVRALTRFGSLREQSAFRAWLYRIIISTFKNRRRSLRSRAELNSSSEVLDRAVGEESEAVEAARRRVEIALQALRPRERALVTLRDLEGWSLPELAAMMNRSEGALRVALSRAHRKMKKRLQKYLLANGNAPETRQYPSEVALCAVRKQKEK